MALSSFAEDIWVAESSSGSADGSSSNNAAAVSFFNTAGNWGDGAGKISAGDTVRLVGTFTTAITAQGSGVSGSPITVSFQPGAKFSKASWSGNVITLTGRSNIIISGGATGRIGGASGNESLAVGVIESTDNGTGLGNTNDAVGVYANPGQFITVKDLVFRDLYVRTSGSETLGYGIGVYLRWNGGATPSDLTVSNCVFQNMVTGVGMTYGPGSSNFTMVHCTARNVNWGGFVGDHGSGATMDGVLVDGNYFHSFTNWYQPGTQFHHNGFYAWAESGGSIVNVTMRKNLIGPGFYFGDPVSATSGLFVSGSGAVGENLIYNNVFVEGTNDAPSNGLVFVWPGSNAVTRIYNNTFIGGGSGNAMQLYGGRGTAGQQQFFVQNNFAQAKTFINVANSATISLVASNDHGWNLISGQEYSTSTNASSSFKTLAQWQALGFDTTSTNTAPLLDGYTLEAGSPLIGAGTDLSAFFTDDFTGSPRVAPWDIGAYEYLGRRATAGTVNVGTLTITP